MTCPGGKPETPPFPYGAYDDSYRDKNMRAPGELGFVPPLQQLAGLTEEGQGGPLASWKERGFPMPHGAGIWVTRHGFPPDTQHGGRRAVVCRLCALTSTESVKVWCIALPCCSMRQCSNRHQCMPIRAASFADTCLMLGETCHAANAQQ